LAQIIPNLMVMIQNCGWIHRVLGDYASAIPYYKRAVEIFERQSGHDHPSVADNLKDLASLYVQLSDYKKAEPLLMRSLDIYEKSFGLDDTRVASSQALLAHLYQGSGNFIKAEEFFKKSIKICEKYSKEKPINLGNNYCNLASLYTSMGHFDKAESYFLEALNILKKNLGPEHSSVAYILHNMGQLYYQLRNFEKAEFVYKRAIEIWEKTIGPENPNVATAMDNLAILYEDNGEYQRAKPLYQKALMIREATFGPNHPVVSLSLNNLATLYSFLNEDRKAENLYRRVLKIKADTFGKEHNSYADTLTNLATLLKDKDEFLESETYYKEAYEIWKNNLGPDHPYVSNVIGHLANLYWRTGEFEKAYDHFSHALEIDGKLIDQVMGFTSENQKANFISQNDFDLYALLYLVSQHIKDDHDKINKAFNSWIRWKGSILESQKHYIEAMFDLDNPRIAEVSRQLFEARQEISTLAFTTSSGEGLNKYRQKMTELEVKKDKLESELSRLSKPFAIKKYVSKVDRDLLAKSLPKKSALLELARIEIDQPLIPTDSPRRLPDRYIAFVLHSGNGEKVSLVDLGLAKDIDGLVAECKRQISGSGDKDGKAASDSLHSLYDAVFKPLQQALGGATEIFISPDGNLNLIPFEVMQTPDGKFLIEDYTFNYLAAGRDIIGIDEATEAGGKPLLMGDPDFNLNPDQRQVILGSLNIEDQGEMQLAFRSANLGKLPFVPLPYAKEELEAIGEILGPETCESYTGDQALEEILMNMNSPEILHLATHGFFLSDQPSASSGRGWQTTALPGTSKSPSSPVNKEVDLNNPLLRSGLLLAGARYSLSNGAAGTSDGIVTAEKILGMNLRGTKMVVLSACDTGLGEVKSGEGVYGLRRAFTQAGAKSLIMSMWKVPDQETKELMVRLYRNIKSGMNRCQALRQAALKQIQIVKERHGSPNPRYWGAFVFMGQP
jgi:tetratricopeptide (TPR) repeat protein